jgi:uncharacterized protein YqgV (UPF0045/DUF77 family)
MKMTAELSMYPLKDDFIPPIKAVIEKLNSFSAIKVSTATTLIGEFDEVMDAISQTLVWSHEKYGMAVFVAKLIPGYDPEN